MEVPPGSRYARLARAVLVAVLSPRGDAAQDRTERARVVGLDVLRSAGGDAEPFGDDGVAAVFDDASAAVDAAAALLHRAGDTSSDDAWRVGLRIGELVMTADTAASAPAVERAEALARLADPGTTAVTASDSSLLGSRPGMTVRPFAATLASEPGTGLVLLVPVEAPAPALDRRRLVFAAGATAVLGVAGALVWRSTRGQRDVAGQRLTLGVGPFRTSGLDPGREWIATSLRDGLNTQLTELSAVRVFSEEFMDFVMTREKLTAIEVANRLGIEKMVTGTVLAVGDRVRVEARIVDPTTGLLEGAAEATGEARDYLALESEVVQGVIQRLGIPLSTDDEHRMAARRTSDPDALRRFLQAEGAPKAPADPEPARPDGPSSGWDGFARTAWADDASAAVATFLEEYRRATEARDTAGLAAMYEDFSAEQRDGLAQYFQRVRDLRVTLEHVDIEVIGDEAVSSYTRNDDFIDVSTGRPQHVTARLTRTLRRVDGRWRFAAGR